MAIKLTDQDIKHIRDALTLYSQTAPDLVSKLSSDVREIVLDDDLTLAQLTKKTTELQALQKKAGRKAVIAELKAFFAEFPEAEALRWTQFTPYFNDGEACIFGVNDIDVRLKGATKGDDEFTDSYATKGALKAGLSKLYQTLSNNTTEPILEAAFGDHVQVTATREKIDVDDYEHD